MSVVFSGTGYGITGASAADLEGSSALAVALRVRGDTLKALAASATQKGLVSIGASNAAYGLMITGRQGADAAHLRLMMTTKDGATLDTMPDVALTALVDAMYYNIYGHRDTAPVTGTAGAREFELKDDAGTTIAAVTPTPTASALTTGVGRGLVSLGAKLDGSVPSALAVDGLAIYARCVAPAARPLGEPPATDATNLLRLWPFGEGSGTTATGEVVGEVLNLTSNAWASDGTWSGADPIVASEIRVASQPDATYDVGDTITVGAAATDAGGATQTDLEAGTVKLRARAAPTGWDLATVLDSDTWVHGVAALSFQVPMAGTWTFGLDDDSNALTDSTASDATTVSMPAGGGSTTIIVGDSMDKGMVAAGSAKQRTLRFRALNASGAPVTGLTGKAKVSINGAAAVDSVNDLVELGLGYYNLEIAAASLAAVDDTVALYPWSTIAFFTGQTLAIVTATDLSVAPDSKAAIATEVAATVLVTPANKLLTDESGNVTSTNAGTGLTPTQQSQLATASTGALAIQAKTDLLPPDPADASDIAAAVAAIPAAILAAASASPIPAEVVKVAGETITGGGTAQDPWVPV